MNDPKALVSAAADAVADLSRFALPPSSLLVNAVARLRGAAERGELELDEAAFADAVSKAIAGTPPELPDPAKNIPNE